MRKLCSVFLFLCEKRAAAPNKPQNRKIPLALITTQAENLFIKDFIALNYSTSNSN